MNCHEAEAQNEQLELLDKAMRGIRRLPRGLEATTVGTLPPGSLQEVQQGASKHPSKLHGGLVSVSTVMVPLFTAEGSA